jgi:uncharacterized protein DUF4255
VSTAYALAAVTAVLRRRLHTRLMEADVAAAVGTVPVSTIPPDQVVTGTEPTQLNIYLHRVTPNPGWCNRDLPSRDTGGVRVAAPPLAVDLHYLMTAYGKDPLVAEVLFGHAMQVMHERPVLTRDEVRAALNATPPDPTIPSAVSASQLADQVEQVRFTLETLSSEESSRMWSALQAHYRMTAPYVASVLLIEPVVRGRSALPVLGVDVGAVDLVPPELASVTNRDDPDGPVFPDSVLLLRGRGMGGEGTSYHIGDLEIPPSEVDVQGSDKVEIDLSALTTPPGVGMHAVQVRRAVVLAHGSRSVLSSDPVMVSLRPVASNPSKQPGSTSTTVNGVTLRTGTLTVDVRPDVTAAQRVTILLSGTGEGRPGFTLAVPPGNGVVPPATSVGTVEAPFTRVPVGRYVVRVEVDRAQSVAGMTGGVFATPGVTI